MPRRSASSLETPTLIGATGKPLQPPAGISRQARTIWVDLVKSLDPEHFAKSDWPLLRAYAEATALAAKADAELARHGAVVAGKASAWLVVQEKAVRAIVALSARLRLSPQSRFSREKAGTNSTLPRSPDPWVRGEDE